VLKGPANRYVHRSVDFIAEITRRGVHVTCPKRGGLIDVGDCLRCERYAGLVRHLGVCLLRCRHDAVPSRRARPPSEAGCADRTKKAAFRLVASVSGGALTLMGASGGDRSAGWMTRFRGGEEQACKPVRWRGGKGAEKSATQRSGLEVEIWSGATTSVTEVPRHR